MGVSDEAGDGAGLHLPPEKVKKLLQTFTIRIVLRAPFRNYQETMGEKIRPCPH